MKTIEQQLAQYKSVHLNTKNIFSHFIGIPLIVFSITLLLNLYSYKVTINVDSAVNITFAIVLWSILLVYYFLLHFKLAIGMCVYGLINIVIANMLVEHQYVIYIAITLFLIGWLIQFIGHYYEKAKPAFFDDIIGLFIGPLFLMAEVYFFLRFESTLNTKITAMALDIRQSIADKEA